MPRYLHIAITALVGIVAAYLWMQLRTERELTAQLRDGARPLAASAELTAAPLPACETHPEVAADPAPGDAACPPETPEARIKSIMATVAAKQAHRRDPAQDSQRYPDMEKEMALGPDEADALYQLLSMRAEQEDLEALLGKPRNLQLQEYLKTIPARSELRRISRLGEQQVKMTPFSDAQNRRLVRSITAFNESQSARGEAARASGATAAANEALRKSAREDLERILEEAHTYLTADQLSVLQNYWRSAPGP